jgi:hypothetical protein
MTAAVGPALLDIVRWMIEAAIPPCGQPAHEASGR